MFDLIQIKLHKQRTMGYKYEKKKQHMDTSDWASVVRMRAPNMFDTAVQTNKLFAHHIGCLLINEEDFAHQTR